LTPGQGLLDYYASGAVAIAEVGVLK